MNIFFIQSHQKTVDMMDWCIKGLGKIRKSRIQEVSKHKEAAWGRKENLHGLP